MVSADTPSAPRSLGTFPDARLAPVLGFDTHLAPVPPRQLTPGRLRERFTRPPAWQPEVREEPILLPSRPVVAAAVLIGIVQRALPTVLLTERSAHLTHHSGQVAFPGGRMDPGDADATYAAMREAHEEVGLAARHVEILGSLPVYTTGTGFAVTPVVGLIDTAMALTLNAHEVTAAFEVPLAFLMNPAHHRRHATKWDGVERQWLSMPFHDGMQERFIWGATAGMLRNLYRLLSA